MSVALWLIRVYGAPITFFIVGLQTLDLLRFQPDKSKRKNIIKLALVFFLIAFLLGYFVDDIISNKPKVFHFISIMLSFVAFTLSTFGYYLTYKKQRLFFFSVYTLFIAIIGVSLLSFVYS